MEDIIEYNWNVVLLWTAHSFSILAVALQKADELIHSMEVIEHTMEEYFKVINPKDLKVSMNNPNHTANY